MLHAGGFDLVLLLDSREKARGGDLQRASLQELLEPLRLAVQGPGVLVEQAALKLGDATWVARSRCARGSGWPFGPWLGGLRRAPQHCTLHATGGR
jgi:hypothetical protein